MYRYIKLRIKNILLRFINLIKKKKQKKKKIFFH
jgi:hypothetical protein